MSGKGEGHSQARFEFVPKEKNEERPTEQT